MQGTFKLGTIAGIDIRVHYSWLIALAFVSWSLAVGYFPMAGAALGTRNEWILGLVSALLLFGSVLVHELAHSLVARAQGLRVEHITLFIFGGISTIAQEATSARDEFLVAVVGPLTSLALGGVFWSIGLVVPPVSATAAVASYLAVANIGLGVFNIVPGFPLDGGRVLRSIVWAVTDNYGRATRIASYVGQAVAFVLIGWGLLRVFDGDVSGGLWIAFIGWFLNTGAEASRQQVTVRNALGGVPVERVMNPLPEAASPVLSVSDFVVDHVLRRGQRALPIVENGRLVGLMSITDAKHLSQQAWATTPVGDVMTRMPLKTLTPESDLTLALELMVQNGIHQLPVVRNGVLVGVLSRGDVMRYLQHGPTSQPPARAA